MSYIVYIICNMVVRGSLLQSCRKVVGTSSTFNYTIQLLDGHISIVTINHTNHVERQCSLDFDTLKGIDMLANDLRDPESLMTYFEQLKDSRQHELIEFSLNERVIINLKSKSGDLFPYIIQTTQQNAQTQNIDQIRLEKLIQKNVEIKMNLLREQYQSRQKQMRKELQSQGISRCCKTIILIFFFFLLATVILDKQSPLQKLEQEITHDKPHLMQRLRDVFERIQNSSIEPKELAAMQQLIIQEITSDLSGQFNRLKEFVFYQINWNLNLQEQIQQEKIKNKQVQNFIKQLGKQIISLKQYISLKLSTKSESLMNNNEQNQLN